MKLSKPIVSVIIPNYNHAAYLPQRIESVLNQSYQHFELLILDDQSPDNSREIINEYAVKDQRITTVFNQENSGSTFKQWNKGVSLTKGEYIWIAESDDVADTSFLEKMIPLLQENKHTGLAYCMSHKIDEKGEVIGDAIPRDNPNIDPNRWKQDFHNDGRSECKNVMIYKNVIANASGALFRKSAFLQAGGAVEGLKLCGDWLTYAKIMAISNVAFNSEYLNYFRVHLGTVRKKRSFNSFEAMWERYLVYKYISTNFEVSNRSKSVAAIRLTTDFLRERRNITSLLKNARRRNILIMDFWRSSISARVLMGTSRWVVSRVLHKIFKTEI